MSQQKAWDCPICGKKGIRRKGVYLLAMNGVKVCRTCAEKQVEKGSSVMPKVGKPTSLFDLELAEDETPEHLYRRAYRDGWIQAINAIGEMMFERKMTRDASHLDCYNHWENELFEWEQRADATGQVEIPPQP